MPTTTLEAAGAALGYITRTFLPTYSRDTTADPLVFADANDESRVFAEFDISPIPPSHVVTASSLLFTTGSNTDGNSVSTGSIAVRPTESDDDDVFNAIGSGSADDFQLDTAGGPKVIPLNSTGLAALVAAVQSGQGWFAVGHTILWFFGTVDATIARASIYELAVTHLPPPGRRGLLGVGR